MTLSRNLFTRISFGAMGAILAFALMFPYPKDAEAQPFSAQIQAALRRIGFSAISPTATYTVTQNDLQVTPATTVSPGINLTNTTAATVGTVTQWSPSLGFFANAWDTDDAISRTPSCYFTLKPSNGNTVTSTLILNCNATPFSSTGYGQMAAFSNTGRFSATEGLQAGSTSGSFIGFSSSNFLFINGTPALSSGFGSGPAGSLISGKTYSFLWDVGGGGTATGGVITMGATASTGYNCSVNDLTTPASFDTVQTASTTTTITVANYSRTTGLLIAWTAGDDLGIACTAY